MMEIPEDVLQVRMPGVNFYVLRDAKGLCLLDAGFIGGRTALKCALRDRGWEKEPIYGVIATHGHLDHILHVGRVAEEHGAWIAAPRLDAAHYAGNPKYRGLSRVTGCLEAIGRPLLGFRAFTPDRLLDEGDELEVWHGLKVIHLPGHTAGHSGFYCERMKLLFCSDLFASHRLIAHRPPGIFNARTDQIPVSIDKALSLELEGVLPNHADKAGPDVHLERLKNLAASLK